MTVQLFCGDCLDILPTLEAGSVDAVVTDPPYPKKYLFLYWFVAEQSRQLLVQGGSYLAIVPHYAMENVLEKVGQHLKYRWIFSMWQAMGQHPRMAMGIEVMWKPIVWWINGSWPQGRGFVRDGFENSQPDKKHHKWEQSLDWAQYCLSVVPRGGTVVDPMMGGGTMGVACVNNGYNFIGIEKDKQSFEIAKTRIEKTQNEMIQAELAL